MLGHVCSGLTCYRPSPSLYRSSSLLVFYRRDDSPQNCTGATLQTLEKIACLKAKIGSLRRKGTGGSLWGDNVWSGPVQGEEPGCEVRPQPAEDVPRSDGAVRLLLSPISQHKTGGTVPLEVLRFVCAQWWALSCGGLYLGWLQMAGGAK